MGVRNTIKCVQKTNKRGILPALGPIYSCVNQFGLRAKKNQLKKEENRPKIVQVPRFREAETYVEEMARHICL